MAYRVFFFMGWRPGQMVFLATTGAVAIGILALIGAITLVVLALEGT